MVEFDRSAFIAKFQEEAQDLLQRLNEGFIALESAPDDRELMDELMRDAHTIKGSSRMVGLIEVSDVAHWLEDIMVKVRDGEVAYTPDMTDTFFRALDAIVYLTDNAGVNVDNAIDLIAVRTSLSALAGPSADCGASTVGTTAEACRPRDPDAAEDECVPSAVGQAGEVWAHTAQAVCEGPDEFGQSRALQRDSELKSKPAETIRMRTTQVDELLNVISEVVISQIKSEQRAHDLRSLRTRSQDAGRAWGRVKSALASLGSLELVEAMADEVDSLDVLLGEVRGSLGGFVKEYAEDTSRGSMVVDDLQTLGMGLRMLPANTIFQAFPRAIRDLAKEFDKEIDLVIEGGETELDKKVLEEINDPLIHIMRNAVDHGIESPEERIAAGKPPTGTIRLAARPEGDRIVIEVADDGAGIDPDRIREAAVRKGYVTDAEARAMTDREAQYLIFEAGFSTAAIITEISGRGVGMDVVRRFIVEKLKGSLDIYSEVGVGTTFRLTIPLTLAIIRALLLRVGHQTFALPTAAIEETLRVTPEDILKVEGREVVRRRKRTYPLVRLGDILGVQTDPPGSKVPIVTIGYSGHRMGLVVDAFAGEQQIVIKTLGTHLAKVDNIAGVTVLGAGDVVPILNVPDLMTSARTRGGVRVGRESKPEHPSARRILICEDSFTTRELERSIFEAAGYDVEIANDGASGLKKLKEGTRIDAVVTDVQMPNMTGFELTRAIKADPLLAPIPVVIVTSLERDEEKSEGVRAGADAYITKSVFNQDTLVDTIERLIH